VTSRRSAERHTAGPGGIRQALIQLWTPLWGVRDALVHISADEEVAAARKCRLERVPLRGQSIAPRSILGRNQLRAALLRWPSSGWGVR
jgi:hypothetical protein